MFTARTLIDCVIQLHQFHVKLMITWKHHFIPETTRTDPTSLPLPERATPAYSLPKPLPQIYPYQKSFHQPPLAPFLPYQNPPRTSPNPTRPSRQALAVCLRRAHCGCETCGSSRSVVARCSSRQRTRRAVTRSERTSVAVDSSARPYVWMASCSLLLWLRQAMWLRLCGSNFCLFCFVCLCTTPISINCPTDADWKQYTDKISFHGEQNLPSSQWHWSVSQVWNFSQIIYSEESIY